MNGEHFFPVGEAELLNRMNDLDAGIADQDVDVAKCLDACLHGCVDLHLIGNIHRYADRLATCIFDLCGGLFGCLLVQIGDHDLCTFTRELQRDFLADAAGGAGDECNLAFES